MVPVMPKRSQKRAEESDRKVESKASAYGSPVAEVRPGQSATDRANSSGKEHHDIPRWRQIEIMRERAELRQALDDIDFEEDGYEDEVFGSEEENEALYVHDDTEADEEMDLSDEDLDEDLDDDLEPDDFDDFEDD